MTEGSVERTAQKGAVEVVVAIATFVLVSIIDGVAGLGLGAHTAAAVTLAAQVGLQALRRLTRDYQDGQAGGP